MDSGWAAVAVAFGALLVAVLKSVSRAISQRRSRRVQDDSPWVVTRDGEVDLVLENSGSDPAHNVRITWDVDPLRWGPVDWPRIDPHCSRRVAVRRSLQRNPREMTVHWCRTPDGDPLQWTTALLQ